MVKWIAALGVKWIAALGVGAFWGVGSFVLMVAPLVFRDLHEETDPIYVIVMISISCMVAAVAARRVITINEPAVMDDDANPGLDIPDAGKLSEEPPPVIVDYATAELRVLEHYLGSKDIPVVQRRKNLTDQVDGVRTRFDVGVEYIGETLEVIVNNTQIRNSGQCAVICRNEVGVVQEFEYYGLVPGDTLEVIFTPVDRDEAEKAFTFASLYGCSPGRMRDLLGIPEDSAKRGSDYVAASQHLQMARGTAQRYGLFSRTPANNIKKVDRSAFVNHAEWEQRIARNCVPITQEDPGRAFKFENRSYLLPIYSGGALPAFASLLRRKERKESTPHHDALAEVEGDAKVIGDFIVWLAKEQGVAITRSQEANAMECGGQQMAVIADSIETVLGRYLGISPFGLKVEKRRMKDKS